MEKTDPFRPFGNRSVMSPRRKQPFFRQGNQIMGVITIVPKGGRNLNPALPISAAVVALDRQVNIHLNRHSIVTEKYPLRQHLPIKGNHNSLRRFPDSGAIHHRLIVKAPNL
ncbi:hypothetical protein EVAR_55754_1 [Eumeta japonica]|uniref:Uncharacterized protein n=1 Tax=Eumeta variegata TaxID=151549 RepID=A0A4C1XE34_EUMVA|nr:hypothetical protein EVAR_55754_1 [Eumeta japonica]